MQLSEKAPMRNLKVQNALSYNLNDWKSWGNYYRGDRMWAPGFPKLTEPALEINIWLAHQSIIAQR
jgi:hypothetical protein